ncbi:MULTISPECIES: LytR/AlgR family response regulator transcription factor [Flammeovirga]|uniref:Response regulator transcription factor n=1 Tax=Flammeovirga agarivorans TaxID=2726742 RepID=A0A7X8XWF0_9BACT|nr:MULTISPECIES: LytTR family DNA-binding domain-containing protein [Flammeovirga]NLR92030.1 response regulator transcription factor [Flammeovirga agarivorans]
MSNSTKTVITCGLLTDDEHFRCQIEQLFNETDILSLLEVHQSPLEADMSKTIKTLDVLFIDVDLPYISGFDWFESLRTEQLCVFISDDASHAVKAFDYNSIDFFLKPLTMKKFYKSVLKIRERYRATYFSKSQRKQRTSLFIRSDNRIYKINYDDILYIESQNNYIQIVTQDNKYSTLMKLKDVQQVLPKSDFIKIQKSFIINMNYVTAIEGNSVIINNVLINISRSLKKDVIDSFTQGHLM